MPNVYYISGGGDSLNNCVNSATTAASSIIYVHPGVYNPYDANRNGALSIIGLDRDTTIIRGTNWNWRETGISATSVCKANNRISLLENLTLSGLTMSDANGQTVSYNRAADRFNYCNCFDFDSYHLISGNIQQASNFFYGMSGGISHCHLSGIAVRAFMFYSIGEITYCEIEHCSVNVNTGGGRLLNSIRKCYVHDCSTITPILQNHYALACIFENIVAKGSFDAISNNAAVAVNCLFTGLSGFRSMGPYSRAFKNCVFVNNVLPLTNPSNYYRVNATGTSADWIVNVNNFYDVPLTSIRNMQAAMNNNRVNDKYCLVENNHFNVKLSALGFVDPENHDYRLKSDSPLLSAGTIENDYARTIGTKTWPLNQQDIVGLKFDSKNPSVGPRQYQYKFPNLPNVTYPIG